MNTKLTISIILMIIGIAAIIISQTVSFTTVSYNPPSWETNDELKYGILYGGIGFLLIGGIILALSLGSTKFSKKENIGYRREK